MTSKCNHNEACARCSTTGHKDDTCTKEFKFVYCGENHASYNKKFSFYKREFDIQHIRVSKNGDFFRGSNSLSADSWTDGDELCWSCQDSGPKISICTHIDVLCIGSEPVTRRKRPVASIINRPVLSVSRSMGTPTRVVDATKAGALVGSSPLKNTKQAFAKAT